MAQPDASTASNLSIWIPLMAGVVMSPALTALWMMFPDLRRRRRLLKLAEVWKPPSPNPSRSEVMINDMLESEVELLWWQREHAHWRQHDPHFAYSIPFFIWLGIVVAVFGWQDVRAFLDLGVPYGLFACFLTFLIWCGPAALVQARGNLRSDRRLMRGNVPRTAEQITELRALHQANALQAPSHKVFKKWLRSHVFGRDLWKLMQENTAESRRQRLDAINSMEKYELDRLERIRILMEPSTAPLRATETRKGTYEGK